jgi:hypothetical protein
VDSNYEITDSSQPAVVLKLSNHLYGEETLSRRSYSLSWLRNFSPLWNPKIQGLIYKSLKLNPILSHINKGHLSLMMEAAHTSETSVDNYFTRQYIPEDNSERPQNYVIFYTVNSYISSYEQQDFFLFIH